MRQAVGKKGRTRLASPASPVGRSARWSMAPWASWPPRRRGRGRRWWTSGAFSRSCGCPRRRRQAAARARGPRRPPCRPRRRSLPPWCPRCMPPASSPAGLLGPPASTGPAPSSGPHGRRVSAPSRAARGPRTRGVGSNRSRRSCAPTSSAARRATACRRADGWRAPRDGLVSAPRLGRGQRA